MSTLEEMTTFLSSDDRETERAMFWAIGAIEKLNELGLVRGSEYQLTPEGGEVWQRTEPPDPLLLYSILPRLGMELTNKVVLVLLFYANPVSREKLVAAARLISSSQENPDPPGEQP